MNKEEKITRLQEVLNEYEPLLRNYNKINIELKEVNTELVYEEIGKDGYGLPIMKSKTMSIEPREIIMISYHGLKNKLAYQAYNVEIPIEDLDLTIKRYKEKVAYWKKKFEKNLEVV